MAEFGDLPNDYEDERAHRLYNRPHDILAGWAVAAFVLLIAAAGFGVEHFVTPHCGGMTEATAATAGTQGCVLREIEGVVAPAAQAAPVSLAEEIGMTPGRRQQQASK